MQIGIFSDVHANFPALKAVLRELRDCDALVHLGDAISIGPFPRQSLELLLETPNLTNIMGNHDWWYVDGLPQPQPVWMSDGEVEHQKWTHQRIGPELKEQVVTWKHVEQRAVQGVKLVFLHYALKDDGINFMSIVRDAANEQLDRFFNAYSHADIVFFGHTHQFVDVKGRVRYINPGSVGCNKQAVAPYSILNIEGGKFSIEHHSVAYNDTQLMNAFEEYQVPERNFLRKIFFGGR